MRWFPGFAGFVRTVGLTFGLAVGIVLGLVPLAGCGQLFGLDAPAHAGDAAPARDTREPDGPPPDPICTAQADPALSLCFSFDANPLPAILPNEGSAVVSAQLTSVTSAPSPLGRAAIVDTASEIKVPGNNTVTGVLSVEVWYRVDIEPAAGGRAGIYDNNVGVTNHMSFFLYRTDPTRQLRCGIGSQLEIWDFANLPAPGTWLYVVCVCDGANLDLFVDGKSQGPRAGPCSNGSSIVADGFNIGQNNNATGAANDRLVGAIDGIRLWTRSLTPQDICKTAGQC